MVKITKNQCGQSREARVKIQNTKRPNVLGMHSECTRTSSPNVLGMHSECTRTSSPNVLEMHSKCTLNAPASSTLGRFAPVCISTFLPEHPLALGKNV
jgi:hypothetical protein